MAIKSLNRSTFLNEVADRAGAHRRDVEHVWESAMAVLQDNIRKGTAVSITGFGKFKQRVTKARKAGMQKNPFTGEMVKVAAKPATKKPAFTPAKQFKEYVAGSLRALPPSKTKPMALAPSAPAKGGAKKAAPKKAAAARKPAAKGRKPAPKKGGKRR